MSTAGRPARARGLALAALLLGACGAPTVSGSDSAETASRATTAAKGRTGTSASDGGRGDIALPPTTGGLDYQLGGASPTDAAVVVRDAGADPEPGAYSVCYVNGFQTQPGDADVWSEHPELLLDDADGDPVQDPDWPDELVLDPSTPVQREGILAIIGPVIRGCAEAGFDAVEIDNLDTFTRFPAIDEAGALDLATAYVGMAHGSGLAIGQKNAAELAARGRDEIGFDLAVAEECAAFDECAAYTDGYGDDVLQVEYPDALEEAGLTFADACARADRAPLIVLRDRDLVPEGQDGHLRETC